MGKSVPSFSQLQYAVEQGITASGLPHPGYSAVMFRLERIALRLHGIDNAMHYAYVCGRHLAIDAAKSREAQARRDAATRERAKTVRAFTERDRDLCAKLEAAIERAEDYYWSSGDSERLTVIPSQLQIVRALYIERATDQEIQQLLPGIKRDNRYKRKQRGVAYVIAHGSPEPEVVEMITTNVATVRTSRRKHQR